jgi:hypothetical protein
VIDMLVDHFELIDNMKMIFKNLPQPLYEQYNNLEELVRTLNDQKYPTGNVWNNIC